METEIGSIEKRIIDALLPSLDDNDDGSPPAISVFKHPVIPNLYGASSDEGSWLIRIVDAELDIVDANDTFYDGQEFFSVVLNEDCTWTYPTVNEEDPSDQIIWRCYDRWDAETSSYAPSRFRPGDTVFPVHFHANAPGGWDVYDASGQIMEYWQCE